MPAPADDALEESLRPPVTVDRGRLRDLSRPTWAWGPLCILGEYGVMFAVVAAALRWPNPISWVVAIVWVGARQHALLVLMHEATHTNLVPNRRVNDLLGEVLIAWPFFVSMDAYRKEHWAHHRHVNTERDPDWARTHAEHARDWQTPLNRRKLYTLLGRDVSGLAAVEQLRDIRNNQGAGDPTLKSVLPPWVKVLTYLGAAVGLLLTGWWWVWMVFWLVPALTYLKMALRLRYLGEHFGIGGADGTRTVVPTWYERLLLAPYNISYHNEHHLFPGVLMQNLPALHAELQARGGLRHERWAVTQGYRGVVREITT